MRNAFIEELVNQARINPNIALVVGDLGFSVVEPFADEFPERFINAGVAEQNMIGLAAGLASEGYHVFVYSIANFPTFRCAEQIRNDVDYHRLPVTIVSVGGGVAYGSLGYSHHAVQDFGLMRCLPNMLIGAPGDPMEVRACVRYFVSNPQPSYLRLGKAGERSFHPDIPIIEPGCWLNIAGPSVAEGEVALSTGAALQVAMEEFLNSKELYQGVYSMPLWGMQSKEKQNSQIKKTRKLTVFEDHLLDCGFASWMIESLICYKGERPLIVSRSLSSEICQTVGSQEYLNRIGGLATR